MRVFGARVMRTGAIRYWPILTIVVLWQVWISLNDYNQIVAPGPAAVAREFASNVGVYVAPLAWTLGMSAAGLLLGMLGGALMAVAVWSSPVVSGLLTPIAIVMRSVPVVALIPLIIQIVGFGLAPVLVVTVVVSFFPAFVMTGTGLRSAPATCEDVFHVLDASRYVVLTRLLLPAAAPHLLVALRLTAPATILASMLAEYLIGQHGLGALLVISNTYGLTTRAWATGTLAAVGAVTVFVLARAVEVRVLRRMT